jgi:hypothetical protein
MAVAKVNFVVQVPIEMKAMIEEVAAQSGVPTSSYARRVLADAVGFELTAAQFSRARKYATVEERIAAQKARERDRRDLVKDLLAKYREQHGK